MLVRVAVIVELVRIVALVRVIIFVAVDALGSALEFVLAKLGLFRGALFTALRTAGTLPMIRGNLPKSTMVWANYRHSCLGLVVVGSRIVISLRKRKVKLEKIEN